jgi:hypothetical protein
VKLESGGPDGAKQKITRKNAGLTPDEAARLSALMKAAKTERVAVDAIRPNPRNARRHPPKQVAVLAESMRKFGFTSPVLVDEDGEILAGHGRYAAARSLGLAEILIIRLAHLSSAEKRALALADNKIAELGRWIWISSRKRWRSFPIHRLSYRSISRSPGSTSMRSIPFSTRRRHGARIRRISSPNPGRVTSQS